MRTHPTYPPAYGLEFLLLRPLKMSMMMMMKAYLHVRRKLSVAHQSDGGVVDHADDCDGQADPLSVDVHRDEKAENG